jgi:hypothetical protein
MGACVNIHRHEDFSIKQQEEMFRRISLFPKLGARLIRLLSGQVGKFFKISVTESFEQLKIF